MKDVEKKTLNFLFNYFSYNEITLKQGPRERKNHIYNKKFSTIKNY